MAVSDILVTLGILSSAAFVLVILASSIFVAKQWEKVAVLRLGRIVKVHDAGVHLRIPFLDRLLRVDMRIQTIDLTARKGLQSCQL